MARRMIGKTSNNSLARRKRIMIWSFVIILVGSVAAPFAGHFLADSQVVNAAAKEETNSRANYWRAVRDGDTGYTSASGPYTTSVLIQNGGQNYRQLRNGPLASLAPWFFALILLAIGAYHLLQGPQKLKGAQSGRVMERWSFGERVLHWYTATLFILLAITGISLFFGRAVLVPVIGLSANAAYASFAIAVHNYLGPFFIVGVILELVVWMRFNIFTNEDINWLKRLGGMFGGPHPHAGRTNGGEKVWFWIIATVGLVGVCVTGLILDFPNFGQSRDTMQLSQLLHGVFSVIWIGVAFGHIYLGVLGTPGTLDGMVTGYVSEEWMKQHHDLWYEKHKGQVEVGRPARRSTSPRTT